MRRRRAVIYDDDATILSFMKDYFTLRGYEVLTYQEPVVCPVDNDTEGCTQFNACADIILTDFMMPKMNGIELLVAQSGRSCKVSMKNKAIISGYIDDKRLEKVHELGCAHFNKPFNLDEIGKWLDEREQRMDLSQLLGAARKEERYENNNEVMFIMPPNDENLKGIAVNMSSSGLCLKINTPLKQEQSVTIYPGTLNPARAALVRWVKEIGSGSYLAGLQFT